MTASLADAKYISVDAAIAAGLAFFRTTLKAFASVLCGFGKSLVKHLDASQLAIRQ